MSLILMQSDIEYLCYIIIFFFQEQMLLNIVIEQMLRDRDPELGGAVQLMGVLRILLDPESMLASVNKSEKADFLNFFYKHSIQTLIGM